MPASGAGRGHNGSGTEGSTAAACATVTFTTPTISGWNPLTGTNGTASFTANVTRITTGPSIRSARIIFLDNQTGVTNVGTSGPQYEVRDPSNNVVSAASGTAVPTSSTVTQFTWGNGGTDLSSSTFTVQVLPTASQDFIAGTNYSEQLKYSIQCFGAPSARPPLGADTNVAGAPTLSLTVPSLLTITTGSAATINFGNFTTTTQPVNIGLKSTSSINVAVSTTNINQMVLAGAVTPFPTNSVIPYTMTLNGDAIANGSSLTNRPRATVAGTNWPLVLTLSGGLPSGKIAGSYQDTITLTLTPGS
jgi:hypothetical protein